MKEFGILAGEYHVCLSRSVMVNGYLNRVLLYRRSVASYESLSSAAENGELPGIDYALRIGHLDRFGLVYHLDELSQSCQVILLG